MLKNVLRLSVPLSVSFAVLFVTACGGKESPKPEAAGAAAKAGAPASGAVAFVSSGLALGKKWKASSQMEIWPDSGKMTDDPGNRVFFHTKEEDSPWLEIDLETPTPVSSVEVVNRRDCCRDRGVPLVVELSTDGKTWKEVDRRTEPFMEWKATFSTQEARYVRLRSARRTYLHLERVGVR